MSGPDLIRLDRRVLPRAEHRAEYDMLRGELGERGKSGLGRESGDRTDRALTEQPNGHPGDADGRRLDQRRGGRKEPRRSDFEGEHGQRTDDEDLGVLDLGAERIRGFDYVVEDFGQLFQRFGTAIELVQRGGHLLDAVTPGVCLDGRLPGGGQIR
ncbi:hypothetical protein ACFC77_18585 [Nocardia colli]|uniref:hypothetical protein n=1 Tax=Nocardia colli TaxID=2545717 RepID=UPI0035E32B62